MKKILTYSLFLFLPFTGSPQQVVPAQIEGNDTIPVICLNEVKVVDRMGAEAREKYREYRRLVYNVKKAIPYARKFKRYMNEINRNLKNIDNRWARKRYLKKKEAELKAQFEKDLKDLTYTQGRILIKLINRETGKTSYELIKQYKSGWSAMWWNTFAHVFGMNLKNDYNPQKEREIETVLRALGY